MTNQLSQDQLSKNFSLNELQASRTASLYGISNLANEAVVGALKALVERLLQPLRDMLEKPIKISSGYRCPELNRRIGGVRSSQHCLGEAVDISVDGLTTLELARLIIASGLEFDQLIDEQNWIHVSYKEGCNRNQVLTAKFSNGKASYTEGLCN